MAYGLTPADAQSVDGPKVIISSDLKEMDF